MSILAHLVEFAGMISLGAALGLFVGVMAGGIFSAVINKTRDAMEGDLR